MPTPGARPGLQIFPMRVEDLGEVLAIEVASFALPWTRDMFESDLARPELTAMLVARLVESGGVAPLAGYLCAWTVVDELHINNLAVGPRWRRRGIAEALLAAGLEQGRCQGARRAVLEVRISNVGAQALYRKFRFEPTGIRRRYYAQPVEDALIMECSRL
ncbi:MAG TPA: ribosomal protein S18-alanine N-acetyltransferase [Candidatus Sulfotelmatobacter sp.]|nr:ribosomal protein S18-alanine N-acetyltransferase [Candidatus Sulfotelmatobacter sp.]